MVTSVNLQSMKTTESREDKVFSQAMWRTYLIEGIAIQTIYKNVHCK